MPIQDYLNVNTLYRTLETGGTNLTPLVLLNNLANVEVMLCVQPIHREKLTVEQTLTARPRATPTHHYLTAKFRRNEIGKSCHESRMCLRYYQ